MNYSKQDVSSVPVVGLTGGIGSGKSTVAGYFAELGIQVIDTDVIARQLTSVGGAAIGALVSTFGPDVLDANGALDREAMRARVFTDPDARIKLETILHPLIYSNSVEKLRSVVGKYAILAVPLLFEQPCYQRVTTRTLVVDCDELEQIRRVMRRSKINEAMVRAIMAVQLPRKERNRRADDMIVNTGSLSDLKLQVDEKHRYYLTNLAVKDCPNHH